MDKNADIDFVSHRSTYSNMSSIYAMLIFFSN